jgi:hypothetical protein
VLNTTWRRDRTAQTVETEGRKRRKEDAERGRGGRGSEGETVAQTFAILWPIVVQLEWLEPELLSQRIGLLDGERDLLRVT